MEHLCRGQRETTKATGIVRWGDTQHRAVLCWHTGGSEAASADVHGWAPHRDFLLIGNVLHPAYSSTWLTWTLQTSDRKIMVLHFQLGWFFFVIVSSIKRGKRKQSLSFRRCPTSWHSSELLTSSRQERNGTHSQGGGCGRGIGFVDCSFTEAAIRQMRSCQLQGVKEMQSTGGKQDTQ